LDAFFFDAEFFFLDAAFFLEALLFFDAAFFLDAFVFFDAALFFDALLATLFLTELLFKALFCCSGVSVAALMNTSRAILCSIRPTCITGLIIITTRLDLLSMLFTSSICKLLSHTTPQGIPIIRRQTPKHLSQVLRCGNNSGRAAMRARLKDIDGESVVCGWVYSGGVPQVDVDVCDRGERMVRGSCCGSFDSREGLHDVLLVGLEALHEILELFFSQLLCGWVGRRPSIGWFVAGHGVCGRGF
jgi:hypothetical protein